MKITDIRLTLLRHGGPQWMDAVNVLEGRACLLVEVDTDAGITGIAEAAGGGSAAVPHLINEIKPMLIGEDPALIERLYDKMYRRTFGRGRRGPIVSAISAIDIALWDIAGKATGRPVYQLLGGYTNRVQAYASGGFYMVGKDVDALSKEMQGYVDRGFNAIKMKIGRLPHELLAGSDLCRTSLEEDLRRVRAVREVLGPDRRIMVDVNRCWNLPTALKMGRKLQELDVYWLEEPLTTDDVAGSAQLAAALDLPIAGYETEMSAVGFRELIQRGAVDIVQPDVILSGGFTETRRIAAMAWMHNLPCVPHAFSSILTTTANLHMIAAIPNADMLEFCQYPGPINEELLVDPPTVDAQGMVTLPSKPGLGVELNRKMIEKYRV
ncbi:MAG: mandelate racemase/muconate lactonizing enzyme family protein [Chloroflexota bacterium]